MPRYVCRFSGGVLAEEKGRRGGGAKGHTFVDVRKVGAEAGDGFEDGLPERTISLYWLDGNMETIYRNGPSSAFMVSASRSSTACL